MIDEGDIPSVQCKMSLRGPKSMRKVDGASLIFIDFYVPVLTPHLNSSETSLQLSENITLFAVCCILYAGVILTVRVTLRLAVYRQSVHLGVKPLETHDQRFFFSAELLR
jgi:hypothetical protein